MSGVSLTDEQQLAKLYFVLPAGDMADCENASEDMKMAYTTAREQHDNEELQEWISEGACLKLDEAHMTNKHVFVFEKFSGPAFERANKAPSTVISPRCLISCFRSIETVPLEKHPVFTTGTVSELSHANFSGRNLAHSHLMGAVSLEIAGEHLASEVRELRETVNHLQTLIDRLGKLIE